MLSPPSLGDGSPRSLAGLALCTVGELFGGVERHVLTLLAGLRDRGVLAPLFLFCEGELAKQARDAAFDVQMLESVASAGLRAPLALAERLRLRGVTILHVHGYKATVYAALARAWYRFAMVKTEHGRPELSVGIRSYRSRLYYLLDEVSTRLVANEVCYVTQDLFDHFQRLGRKSPARIVPNGVASPAATATCLPDLDRRFFHVVVVGRLEKVKGQEYAIRALSELPDVHLHLVGSGPEETNLRTLATALSLDFRVHFWGFQPDALSHISSANLVLIPSLHEGLPYCLLEAMMLKRPIVASNVGGLSETLQDGVHGLLVPPGRPDAISRAVLRVQSDPRLMQALGENAGSLHAARFSDTAMTTAYVAAYVAALSSS